jgi:hypothetical protein
MRPRDLVGYLREVTMSTLLPFLCLFFGLGSGGIDAIESKASLLKKRDNLHCRSNGVLLTAGVQVAADKEGKTTIKIDWVVNYNGPASGSPCCNLHLKTSLVIKQ